MHGYAVKVCWSDEDGAYVADVSELPGCMAHGDTREAAIDAVDEAASLWIETARDDGRSIPEPKGA